MLSYRCAFCGWTLHPPQSATVRQLDEKIGAHLAEHVEQMVSEEKA